MTHSANNHLDWSGGEPPRPEPIEIQHPAIAEQEQTCIACPEQYQGSLIDGHTFYFRYRHGFASLGVGADLDSAVKDPEQAGRRFGDDLEGGFESTQVRDEVFTQLFGDRFPSRAQPRADRLTDAQLEQLREQTTAAILAGDPFAGSNRRMMAATLRWAAEQSGNSTAMVLRLRRWAEQVDATVPAGAGVGHEH
jgi:hypothetical protein